MQVPLETDRLVLRLFSADDVDHLVELNSDPDVMWFLNGGEPTPLEEVRDRRNFLPSTEPRRARSSTA